MVWFYVVLDIFGLKVAVPFNFLRGCVFVGRQSDIPCRPGGHFSGTMNCVLLSDDNSLIPGCLWLLVFVLYNTFILGVWCSTIPHLPGCFCPWTFFQNIGFNVVPSDSFMSHLATQLGYSAGEFQALQLIVLAAFWCRGLTTCLLHVGPPFENGFWNNSWAVGLT